MPVEKTWEVIVEPEAPILLSELEIIVAKGEDSGLALSRPALFQEVLGYWDRAQVRQVLARLTEFADADLKNDMPRVSRLQKQIGGITAKHRLSRATMRGNKLYLAIASTNFMEFIGTNEQAITNPQFRERLMVAGLEDHADANHYFANPLAAAAALYGFNGEPGDFTNAYVPVGMRSNKVMIYPHTYHVFAGVLDAEGEGPERVIDFRRFLQRELGEEAGLRPQECGEPRFHGIIRQGPGRHTEAILSLPAYLHQDKLLQRWQTGKVPGRYEHGNIEFIPFPEVGTFLEKHGATMVPAGAAALTYLQHVNKT